MTKSMLREWMDIVEGKKQILTESAESEETVEENEAELDESEVEEDQLDEKWKGKHDVKKLDKYGKGEKTKAQLKKRQSELRKKKDHTKAETKELRQIDFALRSRNDWKKAA